MITLHASALNRVVACNGSVEMSRLSEIEPDKEQTDDQREGDAAHFVAMDVLRGVISDPLEYVDRKMPNGVYVTAEMAEFVTPFVEHVQARGDRYAVERYIECNEDFDISPSTRILTRPDVVTWDVAKRELTVDEFKYGWRIVEPRDNWTLVAYVMSAITMIEGEVPNLIRRIVHQPRPHHEDGKTRVYESTYDEWYAEYKRLHDAVSNLTTELHTGLHCYKCPALASCRAARDAGYNSIDVAHHVFNDRMPDDALEFERMEIMRAIDMLEQRRDAITELMMHRIEAGAVYQNHAIERGLLGHWKFNTGVNAALIKAMTGIDITKTGMLTVAQAIKAGVPETVAHSLATRPKLPAKLVNKSAQERAAKMFNTPKGA